MGHAFDNSDRAEVAATPEQVWEAIATGPGIDSWFMGRNEVDPGEGGAVRTDFGGYVSEGVVTGWEPLQRFAYRTDGGDEGRFVAYEFLIEGRDSGSTVLRLAASGFLPGDDWEAEYDAMTKGGAMFFRTLVEYLTHFPGRTAVPVTAFGPPVADWERAWAALGGELGLSAPASRGNRVRLAVDGLAPLDGVVYFTNSDTLGLRTESGLYRFLRGFHGSMVASQHVFAPGADPERDGHAWQPWLSRVFA